MTLLNQAEENYIDFDALLFYDDEEVARILTREANDQALAEFEAEASLSVAEIAELPNLARAPAHGLEPATPTIIQWEWERVTRMLSEPDKNYLFGALEARNVKLL